MNFKPNKLKYHHYFLNNVILRRPYLTESKIENVLLHHEEKVVQENGRIAYHGYDGRRIEEIFSEDNQA